MKAAPFKSAWIAAAVATGLLAPGLCAAALSPSDASLFGAGTGSSALAVLTATAEARGGSDFLAQAVTRATPATAGDANDDSPVYAQSATARRNPLSFKLRGNSDLALWNLVAMVNAQQRNNTFDLVDSNVTSVRILELETASVSAVPLPGAMWLFLMGALGLAGTRISGSSTRTGAARGASGVPSQPVPA